MSLSSMIRDMGRTVAESPAVRALNRRWGKLARSGTQQVEAVSAKELAAGISAQYAKIAALTEVWPRNLRLALIHSAPTLATLPAAERVTAVDELLERGAAVFDRFKLLTTPAPMMRPTPESIAYVNELERLAGRLLRKRATPKQAADAFVEARAAADEALEVSTFLPPPGGTQRGSRVPGAWQSTVSKFGGAL